VSSVSAWMLPDVARPPADQQQAVDDEIVRGGESRGPSASPDDALPAADLVPLEVLPEVGARQSYSSQGFRGFGLMGFAIHTGCFQRHVQ
jgi:hypothetical protein